MNTCACGCGQTINPTSTYAKGHFQRGPGGFHRLPPDEKTCERCGATYHRRDGRGTGSPTSTGPAAATAPRTARPRRSATKGAAMRGEQHPSFKGADGTAQAGPQARPQDLPRCPAVRGVRRPEHRAPPPQRRHARQPAGEHPLPLPGAPHPGGRPHGLPPQAHDPERLERKRRSPASADAATWRARKESNAHPHHHDHLLRLMARTTLSRPRPQEVELPGGHVYTVKPATRSVVAKARSRAPRQRRGRARIADDTSTASSAVYCELLDCGSRRSRRASSARARSSSACGRRQDHRPAARAAAHGINETDRPT
jgi:hypothetical protein